MKAFVKILSLVSCILLTSCFTVIETTKSDEVYVDYSEPIVIIVPQPDIYINYPAPEPVTQKKEVYKERKRSRPSNGTKLRNQNGQRSSNKNGNNNRGDNRNSKNVKKSSKFQRR